MLTRSNLICLVLLAIVPLAAAKNKQVLPNYVLQAQTVAVVIMPDAGESVTDPAANRTAELNVEKALLKWGRYRVIPDALTADLIVGVRKGHAGGPAVSSAPIDTRPVILQPSPGTIYVGGQEGAPPDLTQHPRPGPEPPKATISHEAGAAEDTFELFLGGVEYPLDTAPIWRYMAKNAFEAPEVRAVEQFRKAVADSERQQKQKP
jgi:hypothetical protein